MSVSFSKPTFLIMRLRNVNCLFLIVNISDFFILFFFKKFHCSVYGILSIFRAPCLLPEVCCSFVKRKLSSIRILILHSSPAFFLLFVMKCSWFIILCLLLRRHLPLLQWSFGFRWNSYVRFDKFFKFDIMFSFVFNCHTISFLLEKLPVGFRLGSNHYIPKSEINYKN